MNLERLKQAIEHELHVYKYGPDFKGGNTQAMEHVEKIIEYMNYKEHDDK